MVRYTVEMADSKENKSEETTESSENEDAVEEKSPKDDSSKLDEASGSQETEKTSDNKRKEKKDKVDVDRMSLFERELLECKRRQVEMEKNASSAEQKLCKTIEVMMRKLDFVLEHRPWLPPANPSPQRFGFYQPLNLLEAAQRGNASELLRLLSTADDCEAQLRQRDSHGDTALHLAVRGGHLPAARILLVVGAKVAAPGRRLRTPLHCAAANGHLQIVRRLVDAGAPVDSKDADGVTALAEAAMFGHAQVVAFLLKNGACADTVDEKGASPIFLATSGGHTKVIHLLLEKGVSLNDRYKGDSLLVHAAKACQWSVVKLLMDKGISAGQANKPEDSPLALAAKDGEGDIVRELLQKGTAANKEQVEQALNMAKTASVVWALVEAVPLVVRGEAGKWGLLFAAEAGRLEVLIALLDAGVEIQARDSKGISPVHIASWNGHYLCVRELLLRGADAQWKDDNGDTPLHKAAFADQIFCIKVLLEAGAKKDVVNNQGKTPSEVAASEVARRTLDEEGFFYNYALKTTSKPTGFCNQQAGHSTGLFGSNTSSQITHAGNQCGTLFGMSSQSNNERTDVNTSTFGQSNAQVGVGGSFGSYSFGHVNTPPGNVGFGSSGQTFGNEIKGSSTFGKRNASQENVTFGSAHNKINNPSVFCNSGNAISSLNSECFQSTNQLFGNANTSFPQGTGDSSQRTVHKAGTSQGYMVFGASSLFGTDNNDSTINSGQINSSSRGFSFASGGTNGGVSYNFNQTNTPSGSSVFGKPDKTDSNVPLFGTNDSRKVSSPSGNKEFGMLGQPGSGAAYVLSSGISDHINTSTKGSTSEPSAQFDTNKRAGENFSCGYSLFGKGEQSVKLETNDFISLNSKNTNTLFGYKVSRTVSESVKSNELNDESLKNVKDESLKNVKDESLKNVKDQSLKNVKDESLKKLNDEMSKEVSNTLLQELNSESSKEMKDTSLQELNGEPPKDVKDESIQELNIEP